MPGFEVGDVLRVPFPYTDRDTRQHRPAMVVADFAGAPGFLLWVVMITSAENRPWPGDVSFEDAFAASGLPAPSVVRTAKIATIEAGLCTIGGRAPPALAEAVRRELARILGLSPGR